MDTTLELAGMDYWNELLAQESFKLRIPKALISSDEIRRDIEAADFGNVLFPEEDGPSVEAPEQVTLVSRDNVPAALNHGHGVVTTEHQGSEANLKSYVESKPSLPSTSSRSSKRPVSEDASPVPELGPKIVCLNSTQEFEIAEFCVNPDLERRSRSDSAGHVRNVKSRGFVKTMTAGADAENRGTNQPSLNQQVAHTGEAQHPVVLTDGVRKSKAELVEMKVKGQTKPIEGNLPLKEHLFTSWKRQEKTRAKETTRSTN